MFGFWSVPCYLLCKERNLISYSCSFKLSIFEGHCNRIFVSRKINSIYSKKTQRKVPCIQMYCCLIVVIQGLCKFSHDFPMHSLIQLPKCILIFYLYMDLLYKGIKFFQLIQVELGANSGLLFDTTYWQIIYSHGTT